MFMNMNQVVSLCVVFSFFCVCMGAFFCFCFYLFPVLVWFCFNSCNQQNQSRKLKDNDKNVSRLHLRKKQSFNSILECYLDLLFHTDRYPYSLHPRNSPHKESSHACVLLSNSKHLLVLCLGEDNLVPRRVCFQGTYWQELWIHKDSPCCQNPCHLLW